MVESAGGFGFLLESLHRHRVVEVVSLEHFNRHHPVHDVLATFIDDTHTAGAQNRDNIVLPGQSCADQRILRHRNQHAVIVGTSRHDSGELPVAF